MGEKGCVGSSEDSDGRANTELETYQESNQYEK